MYLLPGPHENALRAGVSILRARHRRDLAMLEGLSLLVLRIDSRAPDARARRLASVVHRHFVVTLRDNRLAEERHAFPHVLASRGAAAEALVQRLQRNHVLIERDWTELDPHLEALAVGQHWYDRDVIREGGQLFAALLRHQLALEAALIGFVR